MEPWDPWMFDSGSYWKCFTTRTAPRAARSSASTTAGVSSRLRHAGAVGVGVYTQIPRRGGPSAGITGEAWARGPDAGIHPDPRWQWRLFVGSKGADLRDARDSAINLQMNLDSRHRPEQDCRPHLRLPGAGSRFLCHVHEEGGGGRRDSPPPRGPGVLSQRL